MDLLLAIASLFWFSISPMHKKPDIQGVSTIFGTKGDVHQGGTMACRPKERALYKYACAHRTLPCGTLLLLKNPKTKQMSYCYVMDRGPYGGIDPEGNWFVKRTADEPGTWRGVLDVAPLPAKQLGHNGFQRIKAWKAPKGLAKNFNALVW